MDNKKTTETSVAPRQEKKGVTKKRLASAFLMGSSDGVETRRGARRASVPVAIILACLLIAGAALYLLSLDANELVLRDRYNDLDNQIKDVQRDIENKKDRKNALYPLDEVERLATEEYGMVPADKLPKSYVSLTDDTDTLLVQPGEEENGFHTLVTGLVTAIREILS